MIMYNLIEYSDNYSKTSWRSWQYYRDKTALTDADAVYNFPLNKALFNFKQKKVKQKIIVQKLLKQWYN